MKKIKTFAQACKVKGINPKELPSVSMLPKRHQKAIIAFYMLTIIAEALNGDWKPNWNNWSQSKYYPYFTKNQSGFGFSRTYYDYWITSTFVGSRLCFKSREIAEYAGTQFKKLYSDFLDVPK